MKPILRNIRAIIILATMLPTLSVFAQTDNRNKSRLEVKPKAKTMSQLANSAVFKKKPFSYFQPSYLSLDRSVNYQRSTAINQYFTNSFLIQPKTTKSESVVSIQNTQTDNRNDEFINTDERLFSNDKLTVSNIYPNPADEEAHIDYVLSSQVNEAKITFYNVLGGELKEETLNKDQRKVSVSTKEWPNGIYLYQLSADGRSLVTKKLLVRHQ